MALIGIDTNGLYTTQAGVARYIRGLLNGLKRLAPADLELVPVAWEVENLQYRQPERALKTFYRELIWAAFDAPKYLRRRGVAVLHSTAGPFIRRTRGVKQVVTLHDLAVLRHPERFRSWQRASILRRLQRIRRDDKVICISRFTADEAMTLLNLAATNLIVVHNGCDFHPTEQVPIQRKPDFPLPADYFLFVGSLEPGKNLRLLKAAYTLAESRGVRLPSLLIVGARWEGVAHEGAPPKGWHFLGRVPDEVLVYLYRHAMGLVFPSKYEGFGFPVVEAMSLGCPVICSRVASLPEVGGTAALFADMTPDGYLKAMRQVNSESGLRNELIESGLAQAAEFSWYKCASEVLEVYRTTLRSG